ncbi:MAG: ABC transporter ATP-binding protein [Candidatus Methanoperedens sp.]|nr:ABC transporter ATP-binding protein [Candidatus Methanoperedens sp.]
MIVARKLNKKYGKIRAIIDLDINVKKGTIHGLIGPEACGKTTMLRILSTLVRPDSGEVTINDVPLSKGIQIRKMIGFVPKTPHLPNDRTARELVTFAASLHGIHDAPIIESIMKQTGLEAVADQKLNRFSQVMEKNVAFAMAFVHDPSILLLDEPLAGLDPVSQKRIKEFLLASNKTVLLTGQDLDIADGLCNSVTVMKNGSNVVDGEMAIIRQQLGKGAIEIKLLDTGQTQKLLFELEKKGAKVTVSGESIYVHYENDHEIPGIIRAAANAADIKDARPVKLSIDDIFAKLHPLEK